MAPRRLLLIVLVTILYIVNCEAPFDCSAKPNEVWTPCPPYCPTDFCSLPRVRGICPFRIGVTSECNPKCQCKDGYGRNHSGLCVPFKDCPDLCLINEEYNSCTQAICRQQNCTKRNDPISCPRIDPAFCNRGCVCKENYYRNDNGTCVAEDQCNDAPFHCSAKPNEVWTPCPPYCPTDSCSLPRVRGICPFRIGVTLECKPKCQCKDGYGRNNSGICVPFQDCHDLCPVNEEFNSCTQAICRQRNCTERNDPKSCPRIDPIFCNRGCVCKENYYRNDNGTCVAEYQCNDVSNESEPTCDDTEVLDNCPSHCPSDYCPKSKMDNKRCPKPNPCPPPACKCGFNYRRADNGTCIPTRKCPPFDCSSHPNEQYSPCPPLCPNDGCNLPRVRGICPFRILIRLECNPTCQCEDGYGRLKNGTCVPFAECPDLCPVNQEYNPCPQALCRSQNYTNRSERVPCTMVDKTSCKRDCVCKESYYKDERGGCVTEDQCTDLLCPKSA